MVVAIRSGWKEDRRRGGMLRFFLFFGLKLGRVEMHKALVVACFAGPLVAWSCGSSLTGAPPDGGGSDGGADHGITVEAGELDTTTDGKPSSEGSSDGTAPSDATKKDAGPGKDTGSTDVVEEPPACLPESTDDTTGLYVVSSGGSDGTTCGTRVSPCATVAYALGLALGNSTYQYIYVGPGPFTETAQWTLVNGVTVVGGWEITTMTNWSHNCMAPEISVPATILAPDTLTSPTTLETLNITVTATPSTSSPGSSVYGLMASDASLVLNYVSIHVPASGGVGATGGNSSGTGTTGGSDCTAGSGGPGTPGGEGTAGPAGTFAPTGYTPGVAGGVGATGATAANGTAAPTPTPSTGDKTVCDPPVCTPPCLHPDSTCVDTGGTYSIRGDAGTPGCGGTGGTGGSGGAGGGCSIAIYAWGGSITITGGTLSSGNGGPGGPGGAGAMGGSGGTGTTGASAVVGSGTGTSGTNCSGLMTVGGGEVCVYPPAALGTTAGNGGTGGTGGLGGGGAGGCSYVYYAGGSASVTVSGSLLQPGTGGMGGASNGAPGPAAAHN
jgi:hypothetical protein